MSGKIMDYKRGMKLEFDIYGTTVKGDFVEFDEDNIRILITHDIIKENIGKTQTIHKSHRHYEISK